MWLSCGKKIRRFWGLIFNQSIDIQVLYEVLIEKQVFKVLFFRFFNFNERLIRDSFINMIKVTVNKIFYRKCLICLAY